MDQDKLDVWRAFRLTGYALATLQSEPYDCPKAREAVEHAVKLLEQIQNLTQKVGLSLSEWKTV